jgi:hypothetical protein
MDKNPEFQKEKNNEFNPSSTSPTQCSVVEPNLIEISQVKELSLNGQWEKKLNNLIGQYNEKLDKVNQECEKTIRTQKRSLKKKIKKFDQVIEVLESYKNSSPADKWISRQASNDVNFKKNAYTPEQGNIYFGYIVDRFSGRPIWERTCRFYFSSIDIFFSEAFWNGASNRVTRNLIALLGVFATLVFTVWLFKEILKLFSLALKLAGYLGEPSLMRQNKEVEELQVEKQKLEKPSVFSKVKKILSIRGGQIQNHHDFIQFHQKFLNSVENLETVIEDNTFIFIFAHQIERKFFELSASKKLLTKNGKIRTKARKVRTRAGKVLKLTKIYLKRTLIISMLSVSLLQGANNSVSSLSKYNRSPKEKVTLQNLTNQKFKTFRKFSKKSNENLNVLEEKLFEQTTDPVDLTTESTTDEMKNDFKENVIETENFKDLKDQKKRLRDEKIKLEKQKRKNKVQNFSKFNVDSEKLFEQTTDPVDLKTESTTDEMKNDFKENVIKTENFKDLKDQKKRLRDEKIKLEKQKRKNRVQNFSKFNVDSNEEADCEIYSSQIKISNQKIRIN